MPDIVYIIMFVYFIVISVIAVMVTIKDKKIATKNEPLVKKYGKTSPKLYSRVPERTLLLLSALGGSAAMLVTMKKIRHKTMKPKFMVGIPVIILVQAAAIVCTMLFINNR